MKFKTGDVVRFKTVAEFDEEFGYGGVRPRRGIQWRGITHGFHDRLPDGRIGLTVPGRDQVVMPFEVGALGQDHVGPAAYLGGPDSD